MPIYEYECKKCGHHVEVLQKISDAPLCTCEKCRGKMKKLMSQNSFHLKGTGWYVTDYKSKSGGYDGKTSKKETKTETKEAKSSSKPAAKEASSKKKD